MKMEYIRKQILQNVRKAICIFSIFSTIIILTCSLTSQGASADDNGIVWLVVQGDQINGDALKESHWGWSRSPEDVLCKKFKIDLDPSDIKGFKLHYKIGYDPYDPEIKKHVADKLGNISILVNDKLATTGSAKELASKGWHSLELDHSFLKSGENTVKFTWTALDENKKDAHFGIFYMAIDNSLKSGRSSASGDKGRSFNTENLQVGGPPRGDTQGELMIAIEAGLLKNSKTQEKHER